MFNYAIQKFASPNDSRSRSRCPGVYHLPLENQFGTDRLRTSNQQTQHNFV